MGIFGRKKPKADNSLSTSRTPFWGGSTSGTIVDQSTALQNAAVFACVRVISEAIAALPLHVYKYEEDGVRIMPEHHLNKLLYFAPNPEMSSFVLRETLMSHLLIWGNAYCQIVRDGGGRVRALYPLLPNKMDVWRDKSGEIFYTYWRDMDETRPKEKSGGITLCRDQVLHIPGLSFDGLVGYSPIALAKNTIGMAIAAEDYGADFFANNASPGGILESPDVIKDHDQVRKLWEALYTGHGKGHRLAVLEQGLKFQPIALPHDQAQFLETRKFQLNEIARLFRVPPHMIGDLEKSSFNNIENQSLEFVKYCINPWVVRLEQAMCQNLLSEDEQEKYYIHFNMDGLLRGDYETRMKGYSIGIQNGFMSPNDCRRLENFTLIPAEEGGDAYLVNGNMISVKKAAFGDGSLQKSTGGG